MGEGKKEPIKNTQKLVWDIVVWICTVTSVLMGREGAQTPQRDSQVLARDTGPKETDLGMFSTTALPQGLCLIAKVGGYS